MSREQIVALIGEASLRYEGKDMYLAKSVPKPHPVFEHYRILLCPRRGLLKIVALSRDIQTSGYGDLVRETFHKIRNEIGTTYGRHEVFDFLRTGSIWDEPRHWMMGLLKKERTLACFWRKGTGASLRPKLVEVRLEAHAYDQTTGLLSLMYTFEGYEEYERERAGSF